MRRIAALLAVAAVSSAVTAAAIVLPAGADEGLRSDMRSAATSPQQRLADFQACMKERGFDLSGREVRIEVRPDSVTINGKRVDRDAFRAAQRACGRPFALLPLVRGDLERRALRGDVLEEMRERLERLRSCPDEV